MSAIDYIVFALYMAGILGIGLFHFRRNQSAEDYYVGGRSVPPLALGLSIVATDVGGGFSIGLGGVGFMMGLSGSWLLFTGLLGAWFTAVFIIPRIKGPDVTHKMLSYPVMAFAGVLMGMCARALYPQLVGVEGGQELGLPRLSNVVLPVGVTGVVSAAYFSAIMSTADSTLMASSGNVVGDLIQRHLFKNIPCGKMIRVSQLVTLLLGLAAVYYASRFSTVIEGVFDAYGFLVAGLFAPTLGAFFWRGSTANGALCGIVAGGVTVNLLPRLDGKLPAGLQRIFFGLGLWPVVYGLVVSAVVFVVVSLLAKKPYASHFDDTPEKIEG